MARVSRFTQHYAPFIHASILECHRIKYMPTTCKKVRREKCILDTVTKIHQGSTQKNPFLNGHLSKHLEIGSIYLLFLEFTIFFGRFPHPDPVKLCRKQKVGMQCCRCVVSFLFPLLILAHLLFFPLPFSATCRFFPYTIAASLHACDLDIPPPPPLLP